MPPTLRAGLTLGLAVAAWTFVMGLTGWYRHPLLHVLFWLVIPIQVGVLVLSLKGTAAQDGYLRQVGRGVNASFLGAMIIYGSSILFTTVVFPSYFRDVEQMGRAMMARQGLTPDQIEAAVRAQAPMLTPRASALAGAIGTLVTGLLTSTLAALALHRKRRGAA